MTIPSENAFEMNSSKPTVWDGDLLVQCHTHEFWDTVPSPPCGMVITKQDGQRRKESIRSKPTAWDGDNTTKSKLEKSFILSVLSPLGGMVTEFFFRKAVVVSLCSKPTVWDGDSGRIHTMIGSNSTFRAHWVGW